MRHIPFARPLITGAAALAGLLVLSNARVSAQDVDPRWHAWLGCWEAVNDEGFASADAPRVCIIPAGNAAVDIATLVGDSIVQRQRLDATGEQVQTTRDGCSGWERAQFSANGTRVYLRTSHTCEGGLTRLSNGVIAMTQDGEWLDVRGVITGATQGVRVTRYRDATNLARLPLEIATHFRDRGAVITNARIAAMAPLTIADAVEASRVLDPGVTQTWLAERGDGFGIGATELLALESAGVPSVVIDVMVALSYPGVFALDRSRVEGASERDVAGEPRGRVVDLYGWDPYYSPYGYGYGTGYGYGYGGGWYYGNRPVIIVTQPDADDRRHGRVVNGRGYSSGSEGSTARRGRTGGESGSAKRGSASPSRDSGAADKSTSGGSGRTAKPRKPPE
jgi:hypothetical protein